MCSAHWLDTVAERAGKCIVLDVSRPVGCEKALTAEGGPLMSWCFELE